MPVHPWYTCFFARLTSKLGYIKVRTKTALTQHSDHRRSVTMHPVTLLLTAAVLAGACADLTVDESSQADLLGGLKDKTDNEDEPKDVRISWEAAEEVLELVDELGNVTSRFHLYLYQTSSTLLCNIECDPSLALYI